MKKILIISLIFVVFFTIFIFWNRDRGMKENNDHTLTSNKGQVQENSQQAQKNGKKEETKNNGLIIKILQEGKGEGAKDGNTVSVNYIGTLKDGKKFDSSLDRGVPFSFKLGAGEVIKGWDLGVLGMKVGEKRRLTIPPELAYGERGIGPIPPNSTLIFQIELLSVNREKK